MVAPQYNPWKFQFTGLIVDIVLWSLVIAIIWTVANNIMHIKKGKK